MFLYVLIGAIFGVAACVYATFFVKKSEGVVYGKLDKAARITNVILLVAYVVFSPLYMLLGALAAPAGEGVLWLLGLIVAIVVASAAPLCGFGLACSVALRKKGKSKLGFAAQFAGAAGILLTVVLFLLFYGNLLDTLN